MFVLTISSKFDVAVGSLRHVFYFVESFLVVGFVSVIGIFYVDSGGRYAIFETGYLRDEQRRSFVVIV